jgi:phage gpG-like protein
MTLLGFDSLMDTLDYAESGTAEYVVGTNVEYSIYVEYGTSRNQAQPYLRPAVERAVRSLDSIANGADSTEEIAQKLALKVEAEAKREAPVDTGNLKASISAQKLS